MKRCVKVVVRPKEITSVFPYLERELFKKLLNEWKNEFEGAKLLGKVPINEFEYNVYIDRVWPSRKTFEDWVKNMIKYSDDPEIAEDFNNKAKAALNVINKLIEIIDFWSARGFEIAKALGRHPSTVYYALKRLGLK